MITPVSTIGAGDNFSAGLIYGLLHEGITLEDLDNLNESSWDRIIGYGCAFAKEVCLSYDNSISREFAASYKI